MEQPKGDENKGAGRDPRQQIVPHPVISSAHEQQAPNAPKPQKHKPEAKAKHPRNTWKRKTKRYLLKLAREGPDRHIELLLALVIVFFAWMQWHTAKSNGESTGRQTDQLITAAKINAAAAQQNALAASSFASTEEKINQDLQNAVDRLNAQAQATSDIAEASEKQAAQALVQSQEAKQQSIISTNQIELSQRPWVSASFVVQGPLVFDQDGGHITVLVSVKNTGHSPAAALTYDFKLYPTFLRVPDPIKERETMCTNVEDASAVPSNRKSDETIFAGDEIVLNMRLTMSPEQIKNAMVDIPESMFPNSHPGNKNWVEWAPIVLVSCFAYRPTFTEKQYHTGYILSLDRVDPTNGRVLMLPPTIGTSIPASELLLSHLFGTGTDAN